MPTKHKPLAPKSHTGTRPHLRYVNCACGWGGRITTPEKAQEEYEAHARGEIMPWEIDAAHDDAILEDRRRQETAPAIVERRTPALAERAGNTYTARAVCRNCGYRGKWTGVYHAEDLRDAHRCDR